MSATHWSWVGTILAQKGGQVDVHAERLPPRESLIHISIRPPVLQTEHADQSKQVKLVLVSSEIDKLMEILHEARERVRHSG